MPPLLVPVAKPRQTAKKPWISGKLLSLALVTLSLELGCATSFPPPMELCMHDGAGGADCDLADRKDVYRKPSELQNYIMMPQADFAAFAKWAYQISDGDARVRWAELLEQIKALDPDK
jgi:hypothetical protein